MSSLHDERRPLPWWRRTSVPSQLLDHRELGLLQRRGGSHVREARVEATHLLGGDRVADPP
jgi:hypothetical protein